MERSSSSCNPFSCPLCRFHRFFYSVSSGSPLPNPCKNLGFLAVVGFLVCPLLPHGHVYRFFHVFARALLVKSYIFVAGKLRNCAGSDVFAHVHSPISAFHSPFPHGTLRNRRPAWCFGLLTLPPPHALLPSASRPGLAPCSAHVRWNPMKHRPAWFFLHLPPRANFRTRSMITSVFPVRAIG